MKKPFSKQATCLIGKQKLVAMALTAASLYTSSSYHHLPHTMPGRMIRSLAEYVKIKKMIPN
jgi:hypothetical protein